MPRFFSTRLNRIRETWVQQKTPNELNQKFNIPDEGDDQTLKVTLSFSFPEIQSPVFCEPKL